MGECHGLAYVGASARARSGESTRESATVLRGLLHSMVLEITRRKDERLVCVMAEYSKLCQQFTFLNTMRNESPGDK